MQINLLIDRYIDCLISKNMNPYYKSRKIIFLLADPWYLLISLRKSLKKLLECSRRFFIFVFKNMGGEIQTNNYRQFDNSKAFDNQFLHTKFL